MIDLNSANRSLWREISEEVDLRACLACGSCIVACPASRADPPLLIRTLIHKVVLGLEDELLDDDSPWSCVTCSQCEELCPMGIRPFEIGLAIRRWQCRNDETRIPQSTVELYGRGYTQPVDNAENLREEVGLEDAPFALSKHPEELAEFRKLLMGIEIIEENSYMFEE